MFNKLPSVKKFSSETISIEELVQIVKDNPQKDLISKIRNVEYKSKEYNNLKLRVNCITPHGIFSDLKNESLIQVSNYLYFDIDKLDTKSELDDTKNRLINTFPIHFLCNSVGNKGISFFLKLNDTNRQLDDTFIEVHNYYKEKLIKEGFNIDNGATGLVRKMLISSDNNCYYNPLNIINIDSLNFSSIKKVISKSKRIEREKEKGDTRLDDTINIIPFEELYKQIKFETLYEKQIVGDYAIEDMDYYRIIYPKNIKDGDKHKTYIRIINALYYINKDINYQQVLSYIFHINSTLHHRMNLYELTRFVKNICDNIEKTNKVNIKPRVKRIHFNKNSNLTKKQKQSMGAKISNQERKNKNIRLIDDARMKCSEDNIEPTQRIVVQMTGLSIATVKRYWNLNIVNLYDIELTTDNKQDDITNIEDLNLKEISEKEFFEESFREVEYNYKGFKRVSLKVYKKDEKTFIEAKNYVQNQGYEFCYDVIESYYKTNGLDVIMMDFLYNMYDSKMNKKIIN